MANLTYSDLRFYENMLSDVKKIPGSEPAVEVIENKIIDIKRILRKRNKTMSDRIFVHSDGIDGYVEKFPLPGYIDSFADAYEYFKEYEYLRERASAYDCTGDAFTSWYKIFQKPDGSFWAYHSIGIDI